MSDTRPMHFRLRYITHRADFGSQGFKMHDPKSGICLILQARPKDEAKPTYVTGDGICEASCIRQVPLRLETEARESGILSAKKGRVDEVYNALGEFVHRTLRVMQWRCGGGSHADPIRLFAGFFWSLDGVEWKVVKDTLHLHVELGVATLKWSTDVADSVKQLVRDGDPEPLGHELLREAMSLQFSNVRSAIVLSVAAAEVGIKQFIVKLRPDSKWLVENLPSPPLEKIVSEFLPTLPLLRKVSADQTDLLPEPLFSKLKKAIKLRNEIVHGGKGDLKPAMASDILKTVHDLLYLLDFYSGVEWAVMNVTADTYKVLTKAAPASVAFGADRGPNAHRER